MVIFQFISSSLFWHNRRVYSSKMWWVTCPLRRLQEAPRRNRRPFAHFFMGRAAVVGLVKLDDEGTVAHPQWLALLILRQLQMSSYVSKFTYRYPYVATLSSYLGIYFRRHLHGCAPKISQTWKRGLQNIPKVEGGAPVIAGCEFITRHCWLCGKEIYL